MLQPLEGEVGMAMSQPRLEQQAEFAAERAELATVLSSSLFTRARSLTALLGYLCEKYFRGEAEQIKEYTIAVEVFGRSADFQQRDDSIVRVEIRRLREKLRQYYETEGADHARRIHIPLGQYAPVFTLRESPVNSTADLAAAETETAGDLAAGEVAAAAGKAEKPDPLEPGALTEGTRAEQADEPGGSIEIEAVSARPSRVRAFVFRARWALAAGAVLAATVALLSLWQSGSLRSAAGGVSPAGGMAASVAGGPHSSAAGATAAPETGEIRILAGSSATRHVDRAGKVWVGDRFFTDGNTPRHNLPFVYRTADVELYQASRQGDFRYDIPLKPGVYELRLHFIEPLYGLEVQQGGGETSRIFLLTINDRTIPKPLDIFSDAGGSRTAEVKVFKDISPAADGQLHLRFISLPNGKAMLSALEVLPSRPGMANPVRFTARETSWVSGDGKEWLPDRHFKGGRTIARPGAVAGTDEPELYEMERFGHFSYAIPVAPGRYTVTLKFAERFFGPTNPMANGKGVGSRVFNVYCNGQTLLKDFDIYKEAGGTNRAVVKKFTGLVPDAQGKLLLDFKPVANYALINAIEVLDENWK
jgi:hypothetical protein